MIVRNWRRVADTSHNLIPANRKPAKVYLAGFQLFNFAGALLAVALAGEGFLGAAFLPWFQVERMPLDLFYDIFLLYFALEASKSALKGLAILQMDFCQLKIHHLPKPPV